MKWTPKQQKDLETVKYFIPKEMKSVPITKEDEAAFLAYSERGEGGGGKFLTGGGYAALIQGKRWRGWHMGAWEEGVLEGAVSLYTLLGGENPKEIPPRSVVDFMKREMFKGRMSDQIEKVYRKVTTYWTWWRRFICVFRTPKS